MNSSTSQRRLIAGLAVAVVALMPLTALSGCGSPAAGSGRTDGHSRAPTPPASALPTPVAAPRPAGEVVWSYRKQKPMTSFEKIDGVLVGHTLKRDRLHLTALDPEDGSVLWDRASSPGFLPPGVPPVVTSLGRNVVLLQPSDSDRSGHFWTTVVVIRASTGEQLAASRLRYWITGAPSRCDRRICFEGYAGDDHDGDDAHRQFVMNPTTGKVAAVGDDKSAETKWRTIGAAGLVDVYRDSDGDGDAIGRMVDQKLIWQKPYEKVFGGDYNPNAGWSFRYDKEHQIFTGEVGWFPGTNKPVRQDLRKRSVMVGLDAETGRLLWRKRGVSRTCSPVDEVIGAITEDEDYRCRYRSGVVDPGEGVEFVHSNVAISIQRFDHLTGETIWEVDTDLYHGREWDDRSEHVMLWDDRHLLASQDLEPVVIDVASGEIARAPDVAAGWCRQHEEVPYAIDYYDGDRDAPSTRISGALAELCSESPLPPTEILLPPKSISAEFGDLRVTTSAEEVVAVRAG